MLLKELPKQSTCSIASTEIFEGFYKKPRNFDRITYIFS